ncbi:4522_t:CDS:1, partial [Dentiscutata heterogama]
MAFIGNLDLDRYNVQYGAWLSKRTDCNKKSYNDIRHVIINGRSFFEMKTNLENITFLFDIEIYNKYSTYTWTAKKLNNYYNLAVSIKDKNKTTYQKLYKRILEEEGFDKNF